MKHKKTHPVYVEGCFGCKITTISFGTVPGGAKDSKNQVSRKVRRERELHAYREARRVGEQPDSTTFEGIEAARKRTEEWEKNEARLAEDNPPERMKQLKKSYTNV